MPSAISALGWPCSLLGAGRLVRKSKAGEALQGYVGPKPYAAVKEARNLRVFQSGLSAEVGLEG